MVNLPEDESAGQSPRPEPVLMTPMRKKAIGEVIAYLGREAVKCVPNVVYSRVARDGLAAARTKINFVDPGTSKEMVVYMFVAATTKAADEAINVGLSCDPRAKPEEVKPEDN